ncbi:MAG: DUF975 family protein [Treponema sp.]|nr:DUF975 family protein [Treponema sp.]
MFYNRVDLKKKALADLKGKWKNAGLVGLLFYIPCLVMMLGYFFLFWSLPLGVFGMLLFVLLSYTVFSMLYLALLRWNNILLKEGDASCKNFFRGITPMAIPAFFWLLLRVLLWILLLSVVILPIAVVGSLANISSAPVVVAVVIFCCFFLFIFLYLVLLAKITSYAMMFYALADKPDLDVRKSLDVAVMVTEGFRTNLFVTHLSFFGWAILCVLTLGIGLIWVLPYYSQLMTRAWQFMLREKGEMLASAGDTDTNKDSAPVTDADTDTDSDTGTAPSTDAEQDTVEGKGEE